jgi:hypothetical protein
MRLHPVVRDLTLVAIAVSAGWWLRGAGTTVLAQRSSSSSSSRGSDAVLEFQLSAGGPQSSLTVYSSANHTLYVYPRIGVGNSNINCEYSLTVERPGAPIERKNCPIGEQVPQH